MKRQRIGGYLVHLEVLTKPLSHLAIARIALEVIEHAVRPVAMVVVHHHRRIRYALSGKVEEFQRLCPPPPIATVDLAMVSMEVPRLSRPLAPFRQGIPISVVRESFLPRTVLAATFAKTAETYPGKEEASVFVFLQLPKQRGQKYGLAAIDGARDRDLLLPVETQCHTCRGLRCAWVVARGRR